MIIRHAGAAWINSIVFEFVEMSFEVEEGMKDSDQTLKRSAALDAQLCRVLVGSHHLGCDDLQSSRDHPWPSVHALALGTPCSSSQSLLSLSSFLFQVKQYRWMHISEIPTPEGKFLRVLGQVREILLESTERRMLTAGWRGGKRGGRRGGLNRIGS